MSAPYTHFKDIPKAERGMLVRHVCEADGAIIAWFVFSVAVPVALSLIICDALLPKGLIRALTTGLLSAGLSYPLLLLAVQPRIERAVESLKNP